MLLKLVLPQFDRAARRGSVARWHKAEGEWVRYGEDIVDIKVEEIAVTARSGSAKAVLGGANVDRVVTSDRWDWLLRVTSSDMGVLRRIDVAEGAAWEIGDSLAVLSTEEQEPLADTAESTHFRIVVNPADGE